VNGIRIPVSILFAISLNLLLFYFIHIIVTAEHNGNKRIQDVQMINFIRLQRDERVPEPKLKEEPPEEPHPPEEPPPPPEVEAVKPDKPVVETIPLPSPKIDLPLNITGGPYLGAFKTVPMARQTITPAKINDRVIPTYKVPPIYPPRAMRAGIEGIVTVEFTITADGKVEEPKIIQADPPKIFDRAVLRAIKKWKFQPRITAGKAVPRRATQDIRFRLNNR